MQNEHNFFWCINLRGGGTVGQEAVELICQNARKARQSETILLWPLLSTKIESILMKVVRKRIFGQKTMFEFVNGQIQPRRRKTARRVAERPHTGKPKVSRVTSGYGELMIPLSWVRLSWKKWGLYRRSVEKWRLSGQKWARGAAPRPTVQWGKNKNVVF